MGDDDRAAVYRKRFWRTYAALRRTVASPSSVRATRALARPSRTDLSDWHRRSSEHHAEYRAGVEPVAESAAVLCVTRRPHLIEQVVANVARQVEVSVELVLVPNGEGFEPDTVVSALAAFEHVTIRWPESPMSLGEGLNLALDATSERFVAKFDDDDHYGPHFLADSLRAHRIANAGVVGKHSYYADVAERGVRFLRFPGHEFSYGSTLAGGTLVIDRDRTGDLRFPDVSLGEDRSFLARCHRRGVSTFASDRFNFVQTRGNDNTWRISSDEFVLGAQAIDSDAPEHQVDR